FTDRQVDQGEEVFEELAARSGLRATPVVFGGDEMVVGFDRGRLEGPWVGVGGRGRPPLDPPQGEETGIARDSGPLPPLAGMRGG
ncbi:MAG: hypothetical protein QGG90_10375, partial [Nitrospinota bacterium]|nr:hypothetical protein [Nitrospinota bacterium]